jgi:hypothetical protein
MDTAVVVPSTPLLVPRIAGGSVGDDAPLRAAVRDAITTLSDVDRVVVVGSAPRTGVVTGTWDWRGFGVGRDRPAAKDRLPLSLALGSWLIHELDCGPHVRLLGVADALPTSECIALGSEMCSGGTDRTGIVVVADGSACRSVKAPGHYDERSAGFDEQLEAALREGDPRLLAYLDADLARQLLCTGRGPLQVLAVAAPNHARSALITYADAPYGVFYIVSSWAW